MKSGGGKGAQKYGRQENVVQQDSEDSLFAKYHSLSISVLLKD